jgi:hypothetical protein
MNKSPDKRRVYLVLPIMLIPFLSLAFYALGGGRAEASSKQFKGINAALPEAQFKKDEPAGKMDFYSQSESNISDPAVELEAVSRRMLFNQDATDQQTIRVEERLAALNKEISRPLNLDGSSTPHAPAAALPVSLSNDVSRLERLMENMQQNNAEADPELAELNSMMDKILEIQRPECLTKKSQLPRDISQDSAFVAIAAVIAENQKVSEGSVVKLRLSDTIVLSGKLVPKGHLLFGLATFSNQRLNLQIKNVGLGNSIVPVNLTVFDRQDAMIGINVPQAVLQDAVSLSASSATGRIQLLSGDHSLGLQAAGAGLDAAKNLFSKKLKRLKIKLNAGYPLLLRDNAKK